MKQEIIKQEDLSELGEVVNQLKVLMTQLHVVYKADARERREYLNAREAADYLGVALSTIHKMSMAKTIPAYKPCAIGGRGGRILMFAREDLDNWIKGSPLEVQSRQEIQEKAEQWAQSHKTIWRRRS